MQVEKVRSYPVPRYPTAVQFHEGENIARYVPRRWRGKRLVGQVLLFTAMTGLCSCTVPHTETVQETAEKTPWYLQMFGSEPESGETQMAPLSVPLFVHGNGRGSFGCDSVLPPVYLSEDEAAQVIRETAMEYGVQFSRKSEKTVESKKLPYTNIYGAEMDDTYKGTLALDGYDDTLKIGFEYVSQSDVAEWHKDTDMMSSVETFDMKGTAERLTDALTGTAVFYDPGMDYSTMPEWHSEEDWDRAVDEYCALQKERMMEDLRAQVVDFLEWLKGQGVI